MDVQEVLINSSDRVSGHTGDFVVNLINSTYLRDHYSHVSLSQISLQGKPYNISPAANKLYIRVDYISTYDTTVKSGVQVNGVSEGIHYEIGHITIPPGHYSATQLNAVLLTTHISGLSYNVPTVTIQIAVDTHYHTKIVFVPVNWTPVLEAGTVGVSNMFNFRPSYSEYASYMVCSVESLLFPKLSLNSALGIKPTTTIVNNVDAEDVVVIDLRVDDYDLLPDSAVDTDLEYSILLFDSQTILHASTLFTDSYKTLIICSDMVQHEMLTSSSTPGAFAFVPYSSAANYIMQEFTYDHNYSIGHQLRHNLHIQIRNTDGTIAYFVGGDFSLLLRFKKLQ